MILQYGKELNWLRRKLHPIGNPIGDAGIFFYGIHVADAGKGWNAGYGVTLAILVVTAVILELKLWFRK